MRRLIDPAMANPYSGTHDVYGFRLGRTQTGLQASI